MSHADDSSIDARVATVRKQYAARLNRMFMVFALAEGALFALAVVAVYVLQVVDPDTGVLVLIGIALLGGLALSAMLMSHLRSQTQAIAQARGENLLF